MCVGCAALPLQAMSPVAATLLLNMPAEVGGGVWRFLWCCTLSNGVVGVTHCTLPMLHHSQCCTYAVYNLRWPRTLKLDVWAGGVGGCIQ